MKVLIKVLVIIAISIILSTLIATGIKVPSTGVGYEILSAWRNETGFKADLNSNIVLYKQIVSFTLFIIVIAFTVLDPKYRYYAAFFSIAMLAITTTVPYSELIMSIDWRLILFLAGSMTLAFILKSLRVFEFIVIELIRLTRGSFRAIVAILMFIAWFLAMVLDEATSVVYATMFVFELTKLGVSDIAPLIVLVVLATNTGSLALPVGNPIGIYLAFAARLTIEEFLVKALPLSILLLLLLIVVTMILMRNYIEKCSREIRARAVDIFTTGRRSELVITTRKLRIGLIYLFCFLILIASVDYIARLISTYTGVETDPHTLLTFIPYVIIAFTPLTYDPGELEKAILSGVEWPSLLFFISLFMLGDALKYTGIAYKLAYLTSQITELNVARTVILLLVVSAGLSSLLDNLSVIVAFTPVARALSTLISSRVFYWALLYGGVLGGNFTPIGSTANIVAWGIAEKHKVKITWSLWLKVAFILTSLQVIGALLFAIFILQI